MAEVRGGFLKATYPHTGNLSQFRFVAHDDTLVYHNTTSGTLVMGVTQNHPNHGEGAATLVSLGHTRITVGASLGGGIALMNGGTGFGTLAASGQAVAGFLITGANSGLVGEMIFNPARASF